MVTTVVDLGRGVGIQTHLAHCWRYNTLKEEFTKKRAKRTKIPNLPLKSIIFIGSQVLRFSINRALVVAHSRLSASSSNSLKCRFINYFNVHNCKDKRLKL